MPRLRLSLASARASRNAATDCCLLVRSQGEPLTLRTRLLRSLASDASPQGASVGCGGEATPFTLRAA